jgi:hypothetical protein
MYWQVAAGYWPAEQGIVHTMRLPATPRYVVPMAAQLIAKLPDGPEWLYELKLDGSPDNGLVIANAGHFPHVVRWRRRLTEPHRGIKVTGFWNDKPSRGDLYL